MKKISFFIFFSLTIFLPACQLNNTVLSEKTTAQIVVDISLLNGCFSEASIPWNEYAQKKAYFDFVFKKYNTTPEAFSEALNYYAKDAEKINRIYDQANGMLLQKEKQLEPKTQSK